MTFLLEEQAFRRVKCQGGCTKEKTKPRRDGRIGRLRWPKLLNRPNCHRVRFLAPDCVLAKWPQKGPNPSCQSGTWLEWPSERPLLTLFGNSSWSIWRTQRAKRGIPGPIQGHFVDSLIGVFVKTTSNSLHKQHFPQSRPNFKNKPSRTLPGFTFWSGFLDDVYLKCHGKGPQGCRVSVLGSRNKSESGGTLSLGEAMTASYPKCSTKKNENVVKTPALPISKYGTNHSLHHVNKFVGWETDWERILWGGAKMQPIYFMMVWPLLHKRAPVLTEASIVCQHTLTYANIICYY